MTKTFTAQLIDFAGKTTAALEAVTRQSIQDVFEDAQTPVNEGGRMPVDVGNLRNSLQMSLNGSTSLTGKEAYVLAVAGLELGDAVFGGWTVAYARRIEYGFTGADSLGRTYNQTGRFFARGAAQKWQDIVTRNAGAVR